MKNWIKILSLGGMLVTASVAHAQPATTVVAPPVDTTVTTTTTTDTGGSQVIGAENYGTMPTTGGEPLVFVLGGMLLASSAFLVRRKVTA